MSEKEWYDLRDFMMKSYNCTSEDFYNFMSMDIVDFTENKLTVKVNMFDGDHDFGYSYLITQDLTNYPEFLCLMK